MVSHGRDGPVAGHTVSCAREWKGALEKGGASSIEINAECDAGLGKAVRLSVHPGLQSLWARSPSDGAALHPSPRGHCATWGARP